jgi:hypothetical protein
MSHDVLLCEEFLLAASVDEAATAPQRSSRWAQPRGRTIPATIDDRAIVLPNEEPKIRPGWKNAGMIYYP